MKILVDPKDLRCIAIGGSCKDFMSNLCMAGYESGLCDGDKNRRCCLRCDSECE